jgi:hypothetical protein
MIPSDMANTHSRRKSRMVALLSLATKLVRCL